MESTMEALPETSQSLMSSYDALTSAFSDSLHNLRSVSMLRLEGQAVNHFDQDLQSLQGEVVSLEDRVQELQRYISREKLMAHQIQDIYNQSTLQTLHLNHINEHLQRCPPRPPVAERNPAESSGDFASASMPPASKPGETQLMEGPAEADPSAEIPEAASIVVLPKKKKQQAPCRLVSEAEYATLSTYMTQRIPLNKVNIALEDAAELAEANRRMLAQVRGGGKISTQDWKRAQILLINVANKEMVRGKFWLTDVELKKSSVLKADKTGRAIMTILRHLGRISEIRLMVDGRAESVYILLPSED